MIHRLETARQDRLHAILRAAIRNEADQLEALAFILNGNLHQSDRFIDALAPVSKALDAAWDEADAIANPELGYVPYEAPTERVFGGYR